MAYQFVSEQSGRDELRLPNVTYAAGHYGVRVDADGSVEIFGDRAGLLFLAEVIAACALEDLSAGFHVHLPRRGVAAEPDTSGSAELTIYSASTAIPDVLS